LNKIPNEQTRQRSRAVFEDKENTRKKYRALKLLTYPEAKSLSIK